MISLYLWYTGISKVNFRKVDIFISSETERSLNIVYFGYNARLQLMGNPLRAANDLGFR